MEIGLMKVNSSKLGVEIEYVEDDLITFTSPIPGFPDLNDFLLLSDPNYAPYLLLQSVEDPDICFILVDTLMFFPTYDPNIGKRDLKTLAANDKKEIKLLSIVVIRNGESIPTTNLRAPLVVNFDKKLAKQVILDDDNYEIRTPLFSKGE